MLIGKDLNFKKERRNKMGTHSMMIKTFGGHQKTQPERPYMVITTKNGSGQDGKFHLTPHTYLWEIDREVDRLIID